MSNPYFPQTPVRNIKAKLYGPRRVHENYNFGKNNGKMLTKRSLNLTIAKDYMAE